ncbi:unnamed protein product [Mesocestoides corti]|uniref:DUF7041 domain-containing protein n=1 Tax=Mesocestoides corti TaxID=53468 RepID=A0A0R3UCI1_MESCO|nr:unnamed protein product [Mesocestoides corti]
MDVKRDDYQNIPKYFEHPSLWFGELEIYFHFNEITSQTTQYYHVLPELPHRVRIAVLDLIEEIPEHKPYDMLKHAVITRMNQIYEFRARRLLPNVELGRRSPSVLLAHMRRMVEGRQIGDMELRQVWTKCMPEKIRPAIESCTYDTPLTKLADVADKLFAKERLVCLIKSQMKSVICSNANDLTRTLQKISELLDRLPCDRLHRK